MQHDNLEFSVRYSFTKEARAVIESNSVIISERIIELAAERIKNAIREGKIGKSTALHNSQRIEEIASYAAARMILGYLRNSYLTSKYAVAESKRASSYLQGEDDATIEKVAIDLNISSKTIKDYVIMPVYTYLKFSPRSIDYKLTNRELADGYVKIKKREKIRLIEEAVRKHTEKIPLVKSPSNEIKKAAENLKELLPKIEQQPINFKPDQNPPCIDRIIDSLKKHENLPHQARWYLAVFLMNKGMPIEDIVSLYSNLPDYNEKITRYQLDHAKKRAYATPSCATVTSWGLGCMECKLKNPMEWRSWHHKK